MPIGATADPYIRGRVLGLKHGPTFDIWAAGKAGAVPEPRTSA
jgi:hypothetical protein